MSIIIPASPYIKNKGFMDMLCPIQKYGIPKEADSKRNKNVLGTVQHEQFWLEELDKILNGLTIGGRYIPGRFYFYMNYKYMSTINGVVMPDMVDLYLELCYYIEYVKKNGMNLLIPKARRRGISEASSCMIIDYGWRFGDSYKGGVAAGKKVYADDFISKWRFSDASLPAELSIKKLTDNDNEIIAGYQSKNEYGAFEDKGSKNEIYIRTMHTNPNMFKGLFLNDVVSEEIGEHEKWFEFFAATKDCLMSNNKQKGSFFGYGTSGNVNKGSKDFKRISEEAEENNFVEFLVNGTRRYYYGGASDKNDTLPLESELYKEHKAYQLIGCEDFKLAELAIITKQQKLLDAGDIEGYNNEKQNNPITKEDMFRKTALNNFNMEKLNKQQFAIDSLPQKKYSRYILEWDKDEKGMIKIPWKVTARPALPNESDEFVVYIIDGEHPRNSHRFLYVAGIDSYNINQSKTSKSLGGMCVLIRENNIQGALKKVPVAVIRTRPPYKEQFYEMCLKLTVYYNGTVGALIGNVLGDIRSDGILEWWQNWGADRFLALRPQSFENVNSTQASKYWFSLNKYSKNMMVGVMQTHIEHYSQDIWFNSSYKTGPNLIKELQNYDEQTTDSDNDLADAYGIALVQDIACEQKPKDMSVEDKSDTFLLPEFHSSKDGEIYLNDSQDNSSKHFEGDFAL